MSTAQKPAGSSSSSQASGSKSAGAVTSKRARKTYDHEMSPAEQFALQNVQRAQSALRVVNDAIKSGKPPSKRIITLCTELVQECASIIFPEA